MLEFSSNEYIHKTWSDKVKRRLAGAAFRPAVQSVFYVEAVRLAESHKMLKQWRELAANALEPNPFYEPNYLLAVDQYLLSEQNQHLVLVWSNADKKSLLGLFPISVTGLKKGFVAPVSDMTFDSLIGICTPLISPQNSVEVWRCFLEFMDRHPDLPSIVHITEFYGDGPVGKALARAVEKVHASQRIVKSFHRAVARSADSLQDYVARWSKKKARNVRSRRRKLEDLGALSFKVLTPVDTGFSDSLNAVLALEESGWKGEQGTALTSQPHTSNFARQAFTDANADPETHLAILELDGRIIAGQVNLIGQGYAFFIKSAYDETLSRYGPGVALYAWVLEKMLDEGLYMELDSCADANHALEEIWLERKRVDEVFISAPSRFNGLQTDLVFGARSLIKAMRLKAKNLLGKTK